jgi:hypothetical protein
MSLRSAMVWPAGWIAVGSRCKRSGCVRAHASFGVIANTRAKVYGATCASQRLDARRPNSCGSGGQGHRKRVIVIAAVKTSPHTFKIRIISSLPLVLPSMPANSRLILTMKAAAGILPWILACYGIALYMSLGRPIWIDEFLHFAVAAIPSSAPAWQTITRSITGVNHGQTGVYMMLDYWLLSAFGANAVVLRLPSILSGIFLMDSTM